MIKIFLIGSGGFVGSVFQYLLSGGVQQLSGSAAFPCETFVVNPSGGHVPGFLLPVSDDQGLFGDSLPGVCIH
jgi:CrcB protein